jgi:hypothetical protein
VFIKPELSFSKRWHVEFRQTVAAPDTAFAVPTNNYLYGGICEQGWGDPAVNEGCVHSLAGSTNRFADFNFYRGGGADSLAYFEPNTTPGRSGDRNDLMFFRDCVWTGSAGTDSAVSSSDTYNAVLGVQADGPVFEGKNLMSGFADGILWRGGMTVRDEGTIQCFGVANPYRSPGGTPLRRPYAREQAQPGIRVPSAVGWYPGPVALAANVAYFSRFVPSRDMLIAGLAFNVELAGAPGDEIDGGIYLEYNAKVGSVGLTAALGAGRQVLTFGSPVPVQAGWVYYACLATGALAGAPQLTFAQSNAANLFGASPGVSEFAEMAPLAAGGCPVAMAAGGGTSLTFLTAGPALALLEAGTLGQ